MVNEVWIAVAAVVGVLLGGGLVLLQARKRLQANASRLLHLEQQRLQSAQQTTQARRQIEQLQKEMGELRHLMARRGIVPPPRSAPEPLPQDDAVEMTVPGALQPEAFQATQLIQRPQT